MKAMSLCLFICRLVDAVTGRLGDLAGAHKCSTDVERQKT